MNNVALDVAIGLTFIYLLYSLLATTIKELFATLFTYRGKMLERGIEQMLDGVNYKYRWWNRLRAMINNKFINKVPSNRILLLKEGLFANKVLSHDLYKRLAEKTISDKPSYLAPDTFSDIMIDILKDGKDGAILLKDISASVQTINNPGLQKILKLYLEQANGDVQKFKLILENWFNDMMDRVSGWYKQQAYRILFYIGLILSVVFNISTLEIVDKLSQDKDARAAMVASATKYVNDHVAEAKIQSTDLNNSKLNTSTVVPKKDVPDTNRIKTETDLLRIANAIKITDSIAALTKNKDSAFKDIGDRIDSIKAVYADHITETNSIVGLGWGDYGYTADSIQWTKHGRIPCCAPKKKNWVDKIIYVSYETGRTPRKWLGFLITALAISLGAPFWFDLLNKFVNLRVSGTKPSDTDSTPISKTSLLNQKPDPTAKG